MTKCDKGRDGLKIWIFTVTYFLDGPQEGQTLLRQIKCSYYRGFVLSNVYCISSFMSVFLPFFSNLFDLIPILALSVDIQAILVMVKVVQHNQKKIFKRSIFHSMLCF